MSWNRVSFSEMGSNWPSQNIQPAGAKFPANILISPTYGCAMTDLLVRRGEDALQCDAERKGEERLHVEMGLRPADIAQRVRRHGRHIGCRPVELRGRG